MLVGVEGIQIFAPIYQTFTTRFLQPGKNKRSKYVTHQGQSVKCTACVPALSPWDCIHSGLLKYGAAPYSLGRAGTLVSTHDAG